MLSKIAHLPRRCAPLLAALLFAAASVPLAASAAETPRHAPLAKQAKKAHATKEHHTKPTHVATAKHANHARKTQKAHKAVKAAKAAAPHASTPGASN